MSKSSSTAKANAKLGRKGDPRMHRAVAARLADPDISLFDALKAGGFEYPDNKDDASNVDSEQVTLGQRKNQLSRRLRLARKQCCNTGQEVSKKECCRKSSLAAHALEMRNEYGDLCGLPPEDSDEAYEESSRKRVAKNHPDYCPLFVHSVKSMRMTGRDRSPSMTQQDDSQDAAMAHADNLGLDNMPFPPYHHYLTQEQNGKEAPPSQPTCRTSAVAVSSLLTSAESAGMSLEQLALMLSSNPIGLAKLVAESSESNVATKQQEIALLHHENECHTLYSRCMIQSGMSPHECTPHSRVYLEFARKAWQAEGERLKKLAENLDHNGGQLLEPPAPQDTHSQNGNTTGTNANGDQKGCPNAMSGAKEQCQDENPSQQKPPQEGKGRRCIRTAGEDKHPLNCEAQHLHRLDQSCGHKAIIHQPKEGSAHIDFVVGDSIECYHGIEPMGQSWPSKYKCCNVRDSDANSCTKTNPSMAEMIEKLETSTSQMEPKIYHMQDIDLDGSEWQLDATGTIDEGLAGLFKLGETPVEEAAGA